MSIRTKMISVCMFTASLIFVVNLFMYSNINTKMKKIDEVYISNVALNELADTLQGIHTSMTNYLNTKSSTALQNYYGAEEKYRNLLLGLSTKVTDSEMLLMEKNIRHMSDTYLETVAEIMLAKRGRNIPKYKQYYEEAAGEFAAINAYISSLNNQQFKYNSGNYQLFLESLKYIEVLSTVILGGVILMNIVLVYLLVRSIMNPLTQLAKSANEVAKGNFDIDLVEVNSRDEVGVVTRAFNKMIESIRQYILEIKQNLERENSMKEKELLMESHLKDARLKYLQAQINPHFLFNTLNAGAQLAMIEGADQTCIFIENMADFFRYNVKKVHEEATIREEMKLVDNYIYILNVRFAGEIHFEKQIDEDLLDLHMPSMILQPIVENAVNYGIREIDWEGKICLSVYRDETDVYLSVQDNGVGIKPEVIRQIETGEVERSYTAMHSNGVGLTNVMRRLGLYFNQDKVVHIYSEGENKGTEVVIHMIGAAKQIEGGGVDVQDYASR